VEPGGAWWSLVEPGGAWWSLVEPGEAWWSLVEPGGAWWTGGLVDHSIVHLPHSQILDQPENFNLVVGKKFL
jgi:hypothetical protein